MARCDVSPSFSAFSMDEERWPVLVERCTFASMKARGAEIGDL